MNIFNTDVDKIIILKFMRFTNSAQKESSANTRYLTPETYEWKLFLKRLYFTTKKSNRDAICVKCWRIYPQESRVRHQKLQPDHI